MTHVCHALDCAVPVPPEMLMCAAHWWQVPPPLRRKVWDTYQVGQCYGDAEISSAWLVAAERAIMAVAVKEGRLTHEQAAMKIAKLEASLGLRPTPVLPARTPPAAPPGQTTLINIRGGAFGRPHVYIGRGSPFGNPFSHQIDTRYKTIKVPTREAAIKAYVNWLNSDAEIEGWTKPTRDQILALRGKVLGCYCTPLPCHGEVLIEIIHDSFADVRGGSEVALGEHTISEPAKGAAPLHTSALSSPLRWPGGKRWLAAKLVPEIIALDPQLYVEPFLGGGAIALALPAAIPMLLSDFSEPLMTMWQTLQRSPRALGAMARATLATCGNTREGYLLARMRFNAIKTACSAGEEIERAALMLYLNATSFNGVWRENKQGAYNVPFGDVKTPAISSDDELIAISEHLGSAKLRCADFQDVIVDVIDGIEPPRRSRSRTVIFADSPYHGGFDDYIAGGFTDEQHTQLAELLKTAAEDGIKVFATNANTEFIRSLYESWAKLEPIDENRNVAQKAASRKPVGCLLIRGG